MALNSVGRTNNLINGGAPLQYVWNGATVFGDKWIVLKGAPDYDNVMRFLAFAARPEHQAELARLIGYAPTNPKAYDYLDKAMAARLVTFPDNFRQVFATDSAWWAANVAKWTEICLSGLSG
jgi:putative spermidine/putrescine transport system substrate-binding protein